MSYEALVPLGTLSVMIGGIIGSSHAYGALQKIQIFRKIFQLEEMIRLCLLFTSINLVSDEEK